MTTNVKTCKTVPFKYVQLIACQLYFSKGDLKETYPVCLSLSKVYTKNMLKCEQSCAEGVRSRRCTRMQTCTVDLPRPDLTLQQRHSSQGHNRWCLTAQQHRVCGAGTGPAVRQPCTLIECQPGLRPRVARLCPWSGGGKSQRIYGEMSLFYNVGSKNFINACTGQTTCLKNKWQTSVLALP